MGCVLRRIMLGLPYQPLPAALLLLDFIADMLISVVMMRWEVGGMCGVMKPCWQTLAWKDNARCWKGRSLFRICYSKSDTVRELSANGDWVTPVRKVLPTRWDLIFFMDIIVSARPILIILHFFTGMNGVNI